MQNEKLDTLEPGDRDYPEGWRSLSKRPYLIFAKGNRSILSESKQYILAVYCSCEAELHETGRTAELLDEAMRLSPRLVLAAVVDGDPFNYWFLERAARAGHRFIAVTETWVPSWARKSPTLWKACEAGNGIILDEPTARRGKSTTPSAVASRLRLATSLAGALLAPVALSQSGAVLAALSAGIPVWCLRGRRGPYDWRDDAVSMGKAKLPRDAEDIIWSLYEPRKPKAESSSEPEPER